MINTPNIWAMLKDWLNNDVLKLVGSGAPTNGTSGTGAGMAGPGSTYIDYTNKKIYVNSNTKASPTWSVLAGSNNIFISTEQTGTGSSQNVAHGLGVTPTKVFVAPSDTAPATTGAYTLTLGAHDATNVVVTVTSGKKFFVLAIG